MPAAAEMEPITIIQEKFGVDEATAISLAGVVLRCPKQGEGVRVLTLGDFATTTDPSLQEHAQETVDRMGASYKVVAELGADHDKATEVVLGPHAERDEDDNIRRAPVAERVTEAATVDSKKK